MALSLRAASGGNQAATSATSQAITLPTGTATNDIVYFIVSIGIGTVSGASTTVGTGWTLTTTNDATGATATIVGYKTVTASETAPTVSWTGAGRVAWTAIAIAPGAGNNAAHSLFATPSNTGATATSRTPPATTAVAGNASVILNGVRTSANSNGVAPTVAPPTNWTEPTNGDNGTASGNARQNGAEINYRVGLSTGAVTPSAETLAPTSFGIIHHALIAEGTAFTRTVTDAAGATDSNTPVLTSPSLIETLTDDFATLDTTTKWAADGNGIAATGGVLNLPAVSAYTGMNSRSTYRLTGSATLVQTVALPVGVTCETWFYVQASGGNDARFYINNGVLYATRKISGAETVLFSDTYSATNHKWLRLSESGGTLTYATSPTGVSGSWTTFTTWTVTGWSTDAVQQFFYSGYFGTETSPGSAQFDNLNLPPAGTDYSRTVTDAAGAADSVVYSPVSSLSSDFASMPAFFDGNFGGPAVTAGELHVPTISSYAAAATVGRYRFIGDSVYAKVVTASGASGTRQNSIKLEVDSANSVEMIMDGGVFAGRIQTAGANVDTALGTYNATTHAWWRIRESAGTIFWDTSLDGTTWTNRGSSSHTLNFASTRLLLQAGYYGTETAPPDAVYDNLNTPGAIAYSQTVTDPAGTTDATSSAASFSQIVTDVAGAVDATSSVASYAPTLADSAGAADTTASALTSARTITDVAGATDAASSALVAAQTITDGADAADTVATATARTLTDAAGAVDATSSALAAAQTVTDAAGAADTASPALAAAQTVTDVAGAADSVVAVLSITLTDAAGTVDSAATTASYAPTLTDPAGAVDSVAIATTRTLTDPAGAADATSSTASYAPTLTDGAGAADTAVSALAAAATLTDAAGTSDTAGQATTSARTVTDPADMTDTATAAGSGAVTLTDAAGAADTTISALAVAQTVTDAAGATDTTSSPLAAAQTVTDAAGATDTTATTATYAPTVADAAGAADTVQVSGTGQTQITDAAGAVDTLTQASASSRTLTDPAGTTDTVATATARTLTDSAGAVDTVAASTARTLTDAAGATDTLTQASVSARTITDAADAADTALAASVVARTVTDTAGAADAVSQSAASDVAQTVTDAAGASDSVAAVRDLSVVVTDAVGAVDTADRVVAAQRVLADAAEIVDAAAPVFVVAITLLDAAGAVDTATAHAGELGWVSATRAPSSGLVATRATSGTPPSLTATRLPAERLVATR